MSEQTYSQVVGEPILSMDIEKIVQGNIEIEDYSDIEKFDFKYNDLSIIKPLFNKIFEFKVEYSKENSRSDFGKYVSFKIKNDFNKDYNYECLSDKKRFKFSCKKSKTNIIFDYNKTNVRLVSFNKNKFQNFKQQIKIKNVNKITEMTDGTTIYVVFDTVKNDWFLSTNKSLDAESNFDLPETHKQIFLKECKEKGYDFDKLLEYLFSNKKETHILMFSMRHHLTPIPLDKKENILKFINVYCVSNKIQEYKDYETNFSVYKKSGFANDETKEKMYGNINDITKDLIYYLNTKQFMSFFEKIGCGKLIPFDEYKFNSDKDIEQQIDSFMRKSDSKFKGLMIYTDTSVICFENEQYSKIYFYRPKFSMNDQNNILYKLFMFQLECVYEKNKDKEIFFEYYNDLIELYDIKKIFEYNKVKVKEFYNGIVKWYKMVFVNKTKTENDIPIAYRYNRKKYTFVKILDMIIHTLNMDIENKEDVEQLYRKLILEKLLNEYYIQTKNKEMCKYGSLFNNIFKPIFENETKETKKFKDL